MNKSGTSKACNVHTYWHHMDDLKWFFKIMVHDFKNGVTIPKKFVANIREKISEQVTLKVPDGKTYTVEVAEEQQHKLVLRSGWAEFASAYELEQYKNSGFKNSGNSLLKVRIFDQSGCEKELSCVPLDSIPCMQERKGSHGKQMQSPTGKRLADGSPSDSIRKTAKMNPTDSPSPQKKTGHVPSSEEGVRQEPINSGASQKLIKSCIDLPTGWSMTSEQEAKVISLEQKIQPKIPFYITAMHEKSVASGILDIKNKYAMKHLVNENGTIQLCQLDGSKVWVWIIDLDITADERCAVSKGWMDFIRHNKLQEGDICIFQPSKSTKGVKLIFHPLVQSRCLQPPGYVPSAKRPRHGGAKPPYIPRRTSLTYEQKSKVEEKLRGIQSEIPVYVTVIKKSNVNRRGLILEISLEYAIKYLPDVDKSQLPMTMRLRCPGRSKDYEWEPEFRFKQGRYQIVGAGWRMFVTDNKLELDDICLFNLVKNTKDLLTMDVHIIRKRSV